jgi:hypothetical protein
MKLISYFKNFLLLVFSISLISCGGDDYKNVESIAIPVEIQSQFLLKYKSLREQRTLSNWFIVVFSDPSKK